MSPSLLSRHRIPIIARHARRRRLVFCQWGGATLESKTRYRRRRRRRSDRPKPKYIIIIALPASLEIVVSGVATLRAALAPLSFLPWSAQ